MDVKDIKSLNDRIEVIKKKKVKADMQRELLTSKLEDEIAKYKEAYGVDLSRGSFEGIMKAIDAEMKKVSASIQEEYDLKLEVVRAIESGDIATANKLLGTDVKEPVEEESVKEDVNGKDSYAESTEYTISDEDDDDDFGFNYPTASSISFDGNVEVSNGVDFDDEDESDKSDELDIDDDYDFEEDTSDEFGVIDDEDSEDNKPATIQIDDDIDFDDLSLEDDDDDEDDFGFGNMLKGTKFGD